MIAPELFSLPIRFVPSMRTGVVYEVDLTGADTASHVFIAKDWTSAFLVLSAAKWHEWPDHCPTWTGDAFSDSCRCNTEGES